MSDIDLDKETAKYMIAMEVMAMLGRPIDPRNMDGPLAAITVTDVRDDYITYTDRKLVICFVLDWPEYNIHQWHLFYQCIFESLSSPKGRTIGQNRRNTMIEAEDDETADVLKEWCKGPVHATPMEDGSASSAAHYSNRGHAPPSKYR